LLELPWERPLADWSDQRHVFRDLPIGPSRHLVRFLVVGGAVYALKEEPLEVAEREFAVLRHLEAASLPAVSAVGLAVSPERDSAILATEYLDFSIQYRRLLMRFPLGPGPYRERLLDAMAWLLVDLHRSGVFWGDCSLANTLFRRDGDKVQAFLVDAETSEIHPTLSDGQRAYDLDILVENVAFGLADLAALQRRPEGIDDAIELAENVRTRYTALWEEIHAEPMLSPDDRHAIRARIRALNDLGFAVDDIALEPMAGGEAVRLKAVVANRRFHVRKLERLTGIVALEGQARLLLNDLEEYRCWIDYHEERQLTEQEGADRWLHEVLEPALSSLVPAIGPLRDPLQAYSDVLEEKWILSEMAGGDVGLEAAKEAYIALGAPSPESVDEPADSSIVLDIDWSTGLDEGSLDDAER
jgi:uncharacterized protein DUF4032/lipopolysaccharide kinase (Kdo/WaaP) family protein